MNDRPFRRGPERRPGRGRRASGGALDPPAGDTVVAQPVADPAFPLPPAAPYDAASDPFAVRRPSRSRVGPLVVALVLLCAFVGAAFGIGLLLGNLLL